MKKYDACSWNITEMFEQTKSSMNKCNFDLAQYYIRTDVYYTINKS